MRKPAAYLLVLAVALPLFASTGEVVGAAQRAGAFTLAVLRRDGVILPFANWNGRSWKNYWSTPETSLTVPIGIADVPKDWWPDRQPVETWTAWPTRGARREITVEKPALVPAQCLVNIGLKTNYASADPVPPLTMQPYPKDGLATIGPVDIGHIDVLTDQAPEWTTIIKQVSPEIAEMETRATRAFGNWWTHPFGPAQRAKTPVKLEVLCRSPGTNEKDALYYFEATKHYPNAKNKACDIITFAAGWVVRPASGTPDVTVRAAITDCGMEGLLYTLPLGYFRLGNALHWVVQVSGWGYEHYEVLRLDGTSIDSRVKTAGGSCNR